MGAVPPPPPLPVAPATPQSIPPTLPSQAGPAVPGPEVRNYVPPPSNSWQPYTGDTRSLFPPQSAEPPRDSVRLLPPDGKSAPDLAKPQVTESTSPAPGFPVGIPQFAYARDKVATGLKPFLDGFDWLKSNGYRTALYIVPPGEDDSADRRQFEKYGLSYRKLEVSPQTLSRETVEQFNRIVDDSTGQPLFVYDRDGMLAGGLWYLYFRTAAKESDEAARRRAGQLGLKDDPNSDHRTMWLAIEKYISENLR